MNSNGLKQLVRTIPDYPHEGILFRDITTLIAHAEGFRTAINELAAPFLDQGVEAVVGIEARGFILGGALADRLGTGFVPIRKKGKLPSDVIGVDYDLEYGTDCVEIHKDAIDEGEKVLLVDDLIATGGTALAGLDLLKQLKANVLGAAFVIDLPDLGGREKLEKAGVKCHCLMDFEGL